ncbi:Protein indeterminate-domain 4, chloroplastic [Heracleum sosnowskyi]|uniref:Protein indeterminate-domain 4, chloroplastic n=1 Tax=Heracleum sosnowskyi TaxID=360622 RepID=A0AAD8HZC9_9APIA|nr:Protein indeterminate-domain 4, chloroplastic [Heracleum sosnowskyi]
MAVTTSTASPPPPQSERKRRRQEITGNQIQIMSLITYNDDDVEVIALSVEELTTVIMFPCDLCNKSFIREQNLVLHRRAHNIPLPYVRNNRPVKNKDDEKRKVYLCPETTCGYHDRRHALSDITGLRKHYKRKHSEKNLNCTKCEKTYAVESDLKAHLKICSTKEYACVCGSVFSRWDSYIAHRTPCDRALHHQMSLLKKELFQTSQTTVGSSSVPTIFHESISNYPSNQTTALNSNTAPSSTILASPVPNFLGSNQSVHQNMMTFDPVANNNSTQGNENTFDVNVLIDRLFGVSSVPAEEVPQQVYSFDNLANSANSLTGSLENSIAAGFDKNNFNVCPNICGMYENPHQLMIDGNNINGNDFGLQDEAMRGGDPVLGEFCNTPVNEDIFGTSLEDSTRQNGGPPGSGPNQINQLVQLPGPRVGGDANFPVLQNDFCFWENWGN